MQGLLLLIQIETAEKAEQQLETLNRVTYKKHRIIPSANTTAFGRQAGTMRCFCCLEGEC